MNSYATIKYNNLNPFSGIAPTPYIARSENMIQQGERLLSEETFTLRGNITGHCTTEPQQFNNMMNLQVQLLNAFGSDYQSLDILDNDGTTVIHRDQAKVLSVNFPPNNYGSYHIYLPFEITLQCYPGYLGDKYTAAGYHVLNPVHTVQYQENDEGTIQIEVVTSAKGINTSSSSNNALANAISWVEAFKDWRPPNVETTFGNLNSPCLRSSAETLNRFDGTYEIRETFMVDQYGTGPGILRYSTTYNYDLNDGISTIEVAGSIEGCLGQQGDNTIEDLRQRWQTFDIQAFSYAVVAYNAATNRYDLNPNVVSKSVSEEDAKLRISFSYTFNDDLRPPIFFDYSVTVDYDYENDSFGVSIQGEITDRNVLKSYINSGGLITTNKWTEIEAYAAQINLFSLAQTAFNAYAAQNSVTVSDYPLGQLLVSSSRTEDRNNSKLGLGATFRTQPGFLPLGWQKFDYSISCTLPVEQFKEFPCLDQNGQYQVYALGFCTRAEYNIQANGIAPDKGDITGGTSLQAIKDQMNILIAKNVVGSRKNLDSQQTTLGDASFDRQVTANATVSAEGEAFKV